MACDSSIRLIVQGTQHILREGLTVLGSVENKRYASILVRDKSVCPSHASIRFDPSSTSIEVMDLCSQHGVTVDQRPIAALLWCKLSKASQLMLGTVPVVVSIQEKASAKNDVENVTKREDLSFLLNEDSGDFIDCSLEDTQLLPGRKTAKYNLTGSKLLNESQSSHLGAKQHSTKRTSLGTSFIVPATQQLEESAMAAVVDDDDDESVSSVNPPTTIVTKAIVEEKKSVEEMLDNAKEVEGLDDDDEFFIIPETQQPADECFGPSPAIDLIMPVAFNSERAERKQTEEDYFQMTEQDDENSNDGLYNNKYIEASQNLLQSMDESHMKPSGGASRVSIQPDRSVDSVSFHEQRSNISAAEMSRLVWNDSSKQDQEQPMGGKQNPDPSKLLAPSGQNPSEEKEKIDDDRSITPELNFDEPAKKDDEREVTPDVDFDKAEASAATVGKQECVNAERSAVTPVFCIEADEDNEHEISLNQEGDSAKKKDEAKSKAEQVLVTKATVDAYDMETQVLNFDDPAEVQTNRTKGNSESAYDAETQVLNFDDPSGMADPYDLLTQPMESPKPRAASFVKPSSKQPQLFVEPKAVESKKPSVVPSAVDEDDFLETQPMPPPPAETSNESERKSLDATQPMCPFAGYEGLSSPNIDPADLLTQPMSPPKYQLEDSHRWKTPASTSFDAYDQPTQPLNRSNLSSKSYVDVVNDVKTGKQGIVLGKRKPVVQLVDIKRSPLSSGGSDPYAVRTQLIPEDGEGNVYDLLTQPLKARSPAAGCSKGEQVTAEGTMLEVSHFDPPVNSTVRHSLLTAEAQVMQQKKTKEISPSSNKENHTRSGRGSSSEEEYDEEEDLDDALCLAATLPVGELDRPQTETRPPAKGRGKVKNGKNQPVFKKPTERAETLCTPNSSVRRGNRQVELPEFLTPEHPLLSLPKPDSILMASGRMRELTASHTGAMKKGASKYHFDSSSGSEDEDRLVFKKTNVSVAFEKELEKVKEVSKKQKTGKDDEVAKPKEPKAEQQRGSKRSVAKRIKDELVDSKDQKPAKDEKTSSSSRSRKDHKQDNKEPERKSRREKEKKDTSAADKVAENDPKDRVSTRSRRETQQTTKRPADESVDYQSKVAGKKVSTAVATRSAASQHEEEKKALRLETVSEQRGAEKRESKRQKSGYKQGSPSPSEPAKKKRTEVERPRRTTTTAKAASKKVDDSTGLMLFGDITPPEGVPLTNGRLTDVSATSISSTGSDGISSRLSRIHCQKLIFTRMSPDPYRKCIARAGCKIVEIPELATVLVTDRIFRTYKFLCAVAKGIPIVGQSYLDALQAAHEHEPVDPWAHILCDASTEKRYKFRLRETLLMARKHKLFQDYTVFVTSNTQPPPSELYLILSCAGATALKLPSQSPKHGGKMFVISDPSDAASWPKYKEKYPSIEIVSTEGFMLSIMQHSNSLKKHRLG